MSKTENKPKIKVYDMVLIAMFTAILSVSAYISLPLPNGSHITFLNFISTLIALVFPIWQAVLIIVIWMLLGIVGVPVFIAGQSGIGYLTGPYSGYYVAFLASAVVCPILIKVFGFIFKLFSKEKEENKKKIGATIATFTTVAIISVVLVDVVGAIWWKLYADLTVKVAILSGFVAFIPLDLVKAVVAAQIAPFVKKLIRNK